MPGKIEFTAYHWAENNTRQKLLVTESMKEAASAAIVATRLHGGYSKVIPRHVRFGLQNAYSVATKVKGRLRVSASMMSLFSSDKVKPWEESVETPAIQPGHADSQADPAGITGQDAEPEPSTTVRSGQAQDKVRNVQRSQRSENGSKQQPRKSRNKRR